MKEFYLVQAFGKCQNLLGNCSVYWKTLNKCATISFKNNYWLNWQPKYVNKMIIVMIWSQQTTASTAYSTN